MTQDDLDRLEAIHRAIARLARRQEELEARLARLEGSPLPEPQPADAVPPLTPPIEKPALTEPAPETTPPPLPEARPGRNLEAAFGLTWASRIAVVTVVLALAFFFQYAFERRWINEPVRVLLGLVFAGSALALGERFWRVGQGAYGQALSAAGIAFFYLTFWAAFVLYNLLPESAAFALMALTTAAAGWLAVRYGAPAMAALGLAGGYSTPLLLSGDQQSWFVLAYALVLNLGAALASRARGWRWLEALALAGTLALYISQIPAPLGQRWVYTLFILACYGLFSASALAPVFLAAQILPGVALAGLWAPGTGALWAAAAIAAVGLAILHRRNQWFYAAAAVFCGFWAGYGVRRLQVSVIESLAPPFAALTVFYLLFLAWPVWLTAYRRRALALTELALASLNAAFYFGASSGLLQVRYRAWMGLFALIVALAQMAQARLLWTRDARGSVLAGGIAWVFLVLAAPIQFAGYRVTMAWALEGAAAAWIGVRLAELRAVSAALPIFLLMIARLGFVDSRMYPFPDYYPLVANARLLTFAVAATALWASAWWIRRGSMASAAYLAGHGVILWGLCLEGVGWAARTAAAGNFRSVASTAVSVIVAAYAVLLVAGGAARSNQMTRVLGVGLIGGVVVKLYLYDIWLLAAFYRMAAFAILGALLWVMSYLYSRYRESIGSWWRR